MQLPAAHSIGVVLMYCGSLSMTMLCLTQCHPPPEIRMNISQDHIKQGLEFEEVLSESGVTKDGNRYCYQLYRSSDSIGVSVTSENHNSPAEANKALQKELEQAVKIIEREPKLDEQGQSVGERVVASLPSNDPDKPQAFVLWSDGSSFYQISSFSLRHVLELEKRYSR